jgi:hypothetical protein
MGLHNPQTPSANALNNGHLVNSVPPLTTSIISVVVYILFSSLFSLYKIVYESFFPSTKFYQVKQIVKGTLRQIKKYLLLQIINLQQ